MTEFRKSSREKGPQRLSLALGELIAFRGYACAGGDAQLQSAWAEAAGKTIARQTRAVAIRRGVLHVSVDHAPLLSERRGGREADVFGNILQRLIFLVIAMLALLAAFTPATIS